MPLRSYLIRLIGACAVPVLMLAGWLAAEHVAEENRRQDALAQQAAERLMHEVDDEIAEQVRGLTLLAALPLTHDERGRETLYREALAYQRTYGSHVVLGTADGRMLFNTRLAPDSPVRDLPRPDLHAAAPAALTSGRPAVGDLFMGPVSGQPTVAIAVPVPGGGQPAWVLIAAIEARAFQRVMEQVPQPATMHAELRDSRGEVIARMGAPMRTVASRGEPGHRRTVASGLAPWSLELEVDQGAYDKPILETALRMLLALLGAGLVACAAGRLASRRLSTAVSALTTPPLPTKAGAAGTEGNGPGEPASGIREVDAARARLDRAVAEQATADAQRNEALQALTASNQQLQRLVAALHTAQEDERRRIARDIHDELQQRLAAVRIEVSALGPQAPGASGVSRVDGLVVDAIDATRRIVQDLRPQALDELGLPAALAEMLSRFSALSGIASELDLMVPDGVDDPSTLLSPAPGTCLYRIAQEALNNVRKHSGAGFVHLCLDLRSAGRAELLVSDDGRGVQAGELDALGSFGVRGMSERVRALGGQLDVRPLAAGGTLVHASIPL